MFLPNFLSNFGQYRITLAYLVSLPIVGVAATYCYNWWRQQQAQRDVQEAEALLAQESQATKKKPAAKRQRNKNKNKPVDSAEAAATVVESSDLEELATGKPEDDLLLLAKLQGQPVKIPEPQVPEQAVNEADDGEEWSRVATKQEELAAHWKQKYEQVSEEYEREQAEYAQEKRKLEQSLTRYQQQDQQLRDQIRSVSQHSASLESENHGLRVHNRELIRKVDDSYAEVVSMREKLSLVDSLGQEVQLKQAELKALRSELDLALKSKETAKHELDRCLQREDQVKAEVQALNVKLGHAQDEIKSQREIINGLESNRSRYTTLEIEATARGQMLHKAERDLALLQERLAQSQKEKIAMEAKLQSLDQEHDSILAQLHQLEQRLEETSTVSAQSQAEAGQLRVYLEELKVERSQMEQRISAFERNVQSSPPSEELIAVKKKFAELLHQLSDLRHERDAHKKQSELLVSQLHALNAQLKDLEGMAQRVGDTVEHRDLLVKQLSSLQACQQAEMQWSARLMEKMAS